MAQNIKGITIEINGNTTKLQDSLKGVNKEVYSLNKDLKNLNDALKLDPKNTELLAQKQDVLKRSIEASTDKLKQLKEAQRQMGDYNKLTDQQKSSYIALSKEIAHTENNLKGMKKELKEVDNVKLTQVKEGFEKFGKVVVKVAQMAAAAIAAVGAAAVAAGKKIWELANEVAEYGDTIDKQSQKVGLSTQAYQKWDYAMNIAGTSMQDCTTGLKTLTNTFDDANNGSQSAITKFKRLGISLDELKGKSREEVFERVIKSLQNVKDETEKAALANDMFGKSGQNLLPLLNQTSEETQKVLDEAEKYGMIMGDDAVKASANFEDSLTKLKGTLNGIKNNLVGGLLPSLTNVMDGFSDLAAGIDGGEEKIKKGIKDLMSNIITMIPKAMKVLYKLVPAMMDTISEILDEVLEYLTNNTEAIEKAITDLYDKSLDFMATQLPKLFEIALKVIITFANAFAKALPKMYPSIIKCVLAIVEIIIDNLDLIVEAAVEIVLALIDGIIEALPILIDKASIIIEKLIEAIIRCLPKLFDLGVKILEKIIEGIGNIGSKLEDLGGKLIQGIVDGISNGWNKLKDGVGKTADKITNYLKEKFGIHSPSKVMRDEIGKNLGLGLIEGIEQTQKDVNLAMSQLTSGIDASVNPTINPTANSNPLIIQIENFNNTRDTDIEQLAQELEFYRRNSALARGGLNE